MVAEAQRQTNLESVRPQGSAEREADAPEVRAALPEKFGDLLLTSILGRGGVSEVLKGHRIDDPARSPLAIKRLIRQDPDAIARLLEEARLGTELDSAHVVKVFEQGRLGNRPFLIMEYVEGTDLETLTRRLLRRHQAYPTEIILTLLAEIARGLQILHNHRDPETGKDDPIIHSDLKPSNILLGKDGTVKISDLGIARRVSEATSGLSQTEAGTLDYMAPERLKLSDTVQLSPKVDFFSLGVIAYELCTMRPLFSGAPQRMIQQILNANSFVALALEKMPEFIHPQLRGLVGRLLQAEPERRPNTTQEIISELMTLRDRLKLPVDLAHFVAPYTGFDPLEEIGERITAHLPKPPRSEVLIQQRVNGPITHLKIQQLTELLRKPTVAVADPGMLSRQRDEKQRRMWILIGSIFLLCLSIYLIIYTSLPTKINVTTNPLGTMISMQPDCEGEFRPLQPSPFTFHTKGPWPICLKLEARGYISEVVRIYKPSFLQNQSNVDLPLQKEVCVEVDSKPVGLGIYIDNSFRGYTSTSTTRVCGFRPNTPYIVQLMYRDERWDVEEVQGKAGDTLSVFHDFGGNVLAKATPMQRCERYYRGKLFQRAIEICRVAVTQAETYQERIAALIIQARAIQAQGDPLASCDTLHSALGTAVENRDVDLEREVQDWRSRFSCGPQVRLTASPDTAANPAAGAAAQPAAAGAPATGQPAAGQPAAGAAPAGAAPAAADDASKAQPAAGGAPASTKSQEVVR